MIGLKSINPPFRRTKNYSDIPSMSISTQCPFDKKLGKHLIEGGHDHVHFEPLLIVSSARGGQCPVFKGGGGRTVGVV